MWDESFKAEVKSEVKNFRDNCRYLKITDKYLYENVFKTELSFHSFQTTFKNWPLALLKDEKNYKNMQKLHQEILTTVTTENRKFLKKVKQ